MYEAILEDDFFKNMDTKDEYNTDNQQMESFWSVLKNQLTTETVQRFGIEKVLNALEGTGGHTASSHSRCGSAAPFSAKHRVPASGYRK